MGYSMKDMENAAQTLKDRLEEASAAKGQRLANTWLSNTARGRGLWIFLLWPAWLMIVVFIGSLCSAILEQYVGSPLHYAGMLVGLVAAILWYKASFTREHPFLSFLFASFGAPLLMNFA